MQKTIILLLLLVAVLSQAQQLPQSTVLTERVEDFTAEKPVKIGNEFAISIHTQHPYNPTGREGLVFEKEFYSKYSAYIKLHFRNFDLAKGDYVEIVSPNTGESVIYADQGKIIDQDMTMISDFWSQVIFDEKVIVRFFSTRPSSNYGFDIDVVAYGFPQQQIDEILGLKSICGTDEKEPIICHNGTDMYTKGRAVCKLLIGGSGSCTGWLLGCDGHIMTNNHCIGNSGDAANTDFIFNYQAVSCNGSGNTTTDVVASASTFIKTNSTLDYTLVQLPVNPTNTYGYLSLSSVAPVLNDRIYIIGHPGGRRKEITVTTDQGGDANGNAMVNRVSSTGIRYYADTEGGSSGSPVINFNTNLVVAIHNTGGCMNGSDGRSNLLITDIGNDIPNCGIDSSGTAVVPCTNTINAFPYVESFESGLGSWTQETSDDFDWTNQTGATTSSNTGPTAAIDGQYYMYMEASTPNYPTKNAVLISPCFDLSSINYPQLIFNHHMFGSDIGTLNLEVSTNGNSWITLWTLSGDQGNNWAADTINLISYVNTSNLRFRFNGTTGSGFLSDIAIDAFSIENIAPPCNTVSSFPYTESFESGLGAWTQEMSDDFDWTNLTGATSSNNTGPTAAFSGSYYMYIESSSPNNPSLTAILNSPCFDLTNLSNPELVFNYHMYGASTGTLEIEVSDNGGTWTSIWSLSGDQGNNWDNAQVSLAAYASSSSLKLRFKGTTASSFTSDIAIDAVSVRAAASSCTLINTFPYAEGFENGFGSWIQDINDDFDWTNYNGATPSTGTGPTRAIEGTYYAYMEASNPNSPSKVAILNSPCFNLLNVNNPKLIFSYHLYGTDIGNLQIEASDNGGTWTSIWSLSGDQGDSWFSDTIDLSVYTNSNSVQFRFNGVTGSGFASDIAIDDFSIQDFVIVPSCTLVNTFPYTESFENTLGLWTQSINDDIDWTNKTGATSSTNTGPTTANNGSYYMYIEASSPNYPSKVAALNSPCFDLSGLSTPELSFDYHMYGADMGTLAVEASLDGLTWTTLWTLSGDQGNQWTNHIVSLNSYASATNLRLRFNGTTGSGFNSDIAIDAVRVGNHVATGISTLTNRSFLDIYPNPFSDYIQIETNIPNLSTYSIVNVQGQIVQTGQLKNHKILLNDLSQGVYFIQFSNSKENVTRKIVKQ